MSFIIEILVIVGSAGGFLSTQGILFRSRFERNPILIGILAILAIVSTIFLVRDIADLVTGKPEDPTFHSDPPLENANAYLLRADEYFNRGKYDRAIEDYTAAIDLKPDLAEAYGRRGIAYLRAENFSAAQQDLEQAVALNPDDTASKEALGNLNDAKAEKLLQPLWTDMQAQAIG